MQMKKLQQDMVSAMKAHDKVRKDAISSLIAAIKKVAIDEGIRDNIPDDLVDRIILKEMKLVQEQYDSCPDERAELKAGYKATYDIIKEYAPTLMSEDEIISYIQTNFSDIVATKNKGLIIKNVMADLKGKADGKLINQIVGNLCN